MIRQAFAACLVLSLLVVVQFCHGQTPGAQAAQGDGQPKEPPKISRFFSSEMQRTHQILHALNGDFDLKDLQQVPTIKLRDVLKLLEPRIQVNANPLRFVVDREAFKAENPDDSDILDADITFQDMPERLAFGTILRLALSQVPRRNATFLVRQQAV